MTRLVKIMYWRNSVRVSVTYRAKDGLGPAAIVITKHETGYFAVGHNCAIKGARDDRILKLKGPLLTDQGAKVKNCIMYIDIRPAHEFLIYKNTHFYYSVR